MLTIGDWPSLQSGVSTPHRLLEDEEDCGSSSPEPLAALLEAYQTSGREYLQHSRSNEAGSGNKGGSSQCPKGVCREGSGYVASIRINKRQQKGPVRATVAEAARDRAQMMFMKATRSSVDVEDWIKSLKRKKRRGQEFVPNRWMGGNINGMMGGGTVDPGVGKAALTTALEKLMKESGEPIDGAMEGRSREEYLGKLQMEQEELKNQQVAILHELMLTQQSLLMCQSTEYWDLGEGGDSFEAALEL
jgi:hypothetical protein